MQIYFAIIAPFSAVVVFCHVLSTNDLKNLWLYTFENWSIEQADRYYNLIMNEIDYLTQNPGSGKDYGEVRKGYFRAKVKSHYIFYKVNVKQNKLEIIRISHQQMDIKSRLDD